MAIAFGACSTPYTAIRKLKSFDELEYKFPVKKVYLPENEFTIAYTDEGKGENTIIFIHGLGSYLRAWEKNIGELSKNNRCIAIDLPGYGKSSKEPHSGLMTFYAGIVNELVKELKLGKVVIAGHSMGGQIGITTYLEYPQIVKGLVLASPAGFEHFTKGQKQWFRDVMTVDGVRLTTPEAIQNNLASNFYRTPKDADFMVSERMEMRSAPEFIPYCYAVVQSVHGMVNNPVRDYLQDVKVPVLILFGENDNLIPNRYLNPGKTVDIANYGASKIPNNRLVMIPKTGHFLMFEKPEVFNKETTEFLKGLK